MKKITVWRPDTCGCELHLEWDDAAPIESRTHDPVHVVPCEHHAHHPTHAHAHAAVLAENQGKNRAMAALLEHAPHLEGQAIGFSFDETRNLVLHGHELPPGTRAAVQAAISAKVARPVTLG